MKMLGRLAVFGLALFATACGEATAPSEPAAVRFREARELAPDIYAVHLPAGLQISEIEAAARALCSGKQICKVMGFSSADAVPTAMPMTDRELASLVFNYGLNRNTGFDEALWDCRVFEGLPADRCLSRP